MACDRLEGSPSSSRRICRYDVFLSFRGDDTRNNFTDHLYNHLLRKGIFTFKDDKTLHKGLPISPQLLLAIRESRVSMVVFSKGYASSTWCLEEMTAIFDCHQELKQLVFPVFYDVDPSHVRKQNGVYEDAFFNHTEKFIEDPAKVDRWKKAMTGLANFVGWDVRDKQEFREIEKIVQKVVRTLNHKFSGFADDLVGIQPRIERLEKLLKLSSEDDEFRVLGIWGMGGIGKTTHATVLYDRISYQFDACCFIENVRKIYKDGAAAAVQRQILRQTLDETNLDRYSHSELSGIIANRLHNMKVLVALDNVDQLEQLYELAINPKLLIAGSRIIITTRDEHILKVYGADEVYNVPLLSNDDAHELFCRKAFKRLDSNNNCEGLIPEVLKYAQSLPLTIRVLGSFLCTRNVSQWRDALDRLGGNPDNRTMDVLQVSFEGLQSEEKEIFLHIACFFRGEREDYVKRILDGCRLHPHIGIPVLTEKSLITMRNQEIHMHEMLQELGRKIVREKYPEEPGSWSRLWRYKDFHRVLMAEMGTNNIEAIVLNEKEGVSICSPLKAEGLSKMRGLKLLILNHIGFSGAFNFLSNSLQYLSWHDYPFSSLPQNFEPYDSLVELNLTGSRIKNLWEGRKHLPSLKRVDLSGSQYLIETPHFEGAPNLERLDLSGCTNLTLVHRSIGRLKQLVFLSLRNCCSLVDVRSLSSITSLIVLNLSSCTKLEHTPVFSLLSKLEHLDLEQCTSLSTVDRSIGDLANLKFLSLRDCTNLLSLPNSVNFMKSLQTLDSRNCLKLKSNFPLGRTPMFGESLICLDLGFCNLGAVPDAIGELRCLERLNLEGNLFSSLPQTFNKLCSLAYLNLSHCHSLESLPMLPSSSASSAGNYFKTVSQSRNHRSGLYMVNCVKVVDGHPSSQEENSTALLKMALEWLIRLVKDPRHFRCGFDIVIPWYDGIMIPWCLEFPTQSIRVNELQVDSYGECVGFIFCALLEYKLHPLYLSFESEHVEECFQLPLHLELDKNRRKHLWLIYISRSHCHFIKTGARITFKSGSTWKASKWSIRRVFKHQTEVDQLMQEEVDLSAAYQRFNISYGPGGSKIQLPFNWFVTEEEENEKMEAEEKETNLSNVGLL